MKWLLCIDGKLKSGFLVLALFFCQFLSAQEKNDVVLKLNGDEMIGKVMEINDDHIRFVHKDESVVYTVKKADILKITFASGRIEFFNKPSLPSEGSEAVAKPESSVGKLQDHHNKLAILPFHYISDKQDVSQEVTYKVQQESYTFLVKHLDNIQLQDVNTTNALLIKAGVNDNNLRGFTMGEICDILGVEYVIQATVTQNRTSVSTSSGTSSSYKANSSSNSNQKNGIGAIFSSAGSSSSYSSSTQHYQTAITMNVFTDKGDNIFSKDHTSFWDTNDAYKVTLQYLLKRLPFYRK